MTDAEIAEKQTQLAAERTKLERERLEFEQKKMQRLTIAISCVAVVVSLLQVMVAFLQSRLTTAQTVERFIPHLEKQETRDAALLTMSAFIDQNFVTQLAERFKATVVLETLKEKGSEQEKTQASNALTALDISRTDLIGRIFSPDKEVRIKATGELVRLWIGDPKVVPEVIGAASAQLGNQFGVVNALVVLREAPSETLRANAPELSAFVERAKTNGPQTSALAAQVIEKSLRGR